MTSARISLDGGVSFLNDSSGAVPVERDPTLLVTRGRVVRRHSAAFWRATDLAVPAGSGATRVLRLPEDGPGGGGLVVVSDRWRNTSATSLAADAYVGLHTGPVPDTPFSIGRLSALFSGWVARSNALRAQAGLPPLIGDAAISRAAENHSRYWTLNPSPPRERALDVHREVPGTPGFTGVTVPDRCEAVGTTCAGEIMGSDPGPTSPNRELSSTKAIDG